MHPSLLIDQIVLREIRLPLREPFRISSGEVHDRRILLLELHHPDGTIGWGECVAGERPNYSAETVDTARLAIRAWLAPRVIGRAFDQPGDVHAVLARNLRGHRMARAAVEMGMWELAARLADQPLARMLGGTRDRVEVGISLGIQESEATLVEKAGAALDAGYRKIKLKIQPGADIKYVSAVREALGQDAPLAVDANAAYTLADADHLARLDELDIEMLEQPLDGEDLVRHARLAERLSTPICLDESITSASRAEDMIALGSGGIVNIKPGRVGGFAESRRIHDICDRADIPVWCGGMLESGIGRAHNIALASLANFQRPGDLSPSARYWERDIVDPEWTMNPDGTVAVPWDRSGMGVTVDRDHVEDLTMRREIVT